MVEIVLGPSLPHMHLLYTHLGCLGRRPSFACCPPKPAPDGVVAGAIESSARLPRVRPPGAAPCTRRTPLNSLAHRTHTCADACALDDRATYISRRNTAPSSSSAPDSARHTLSTSSEVAVNVPDVAAGFAKDPPSARLALTNRSNIRILVSRSEIGGPSEAAADFCCTLADPVPFHPGPSG